MKVFTVRHGQTNYNLKHLCNDDPLVNVFLTDKGKEQSRVVAQKLKEHHFDEIFISQIPRTKETADFINKFHNVKIKVESRLNDRKTGLEGGSTSEFNVLMKGDLFNKKLDNGESFQEEKERVFSFLDELASSNAENVLIVSHHEIIKIITGYFLGLSDQELWDLKIVNGTINEFSFKN